MKLRNGTRKLMHSSNPAVVASPHGAATAASCAVSIADAPSRVVHAWRRWLELREAGTRSEQGCQAREFSAAQDFAREAIVRETRNGR